MGVNFFEGGRRITAIIATLILMGCAAWFAFEGGEDRVVLETSAPDERASWTLRSCDYPDQWRPWSEKSNFGDNDPVRLGMCFRANKDKKIVVGFGPEQQLQLDSFDGLRPPPVTYRQHVAAEAWSPEAEAYMREQMNAFEFTSDEAREIDKKQWTLRWSRFAQNVATAAPWVMGLLFGLWIISSGIGWIVRGFAGVPVRKDFRPDSEGAKRQVPQRVSTGWIMVTVYGFGIAWAIAYWSTSGSGNGGGGLDFGKILLWLAKAVAVIAGFGIAGFGGYKFGQLLNIMFPKRFKAENYDILPLAFVNVVLTAVVSFPVNRFTFVGTWADSIDKWSRANGYADGASVAFFTLWLLWPWAVVALVREIRRLRSKPESAPADEETAPPQG